PNATVIAALFDDASIAPEVIHEHRKLPELPCAMEIVDENLLQFVKKANPNMLKGILDESPKMVLLLEFDSVNDRMQKRMAKKAIKILNKYQVPYCQETEPQKKE